MPKRKISIVFCVAAIWLVSSFSHSSAVTPGPQFDVDHHFLGGIVEPEGALVLDVTSDDRPDVLISTGYDTESELLVYPQLEDGSLGEPMRLPAGWGNTKALAAGDLNDDGEIDVALAAGEGVRIYYQGPDGLQAPVLLDVPGDNEVFQVEVADVGEDGDQDIVASSGELVLLTNEDSSFTPSIVSPLFWDEVELGDVTNDGRADIVVAEDATVHVFPQLEDGSFDEPIDYSTQGGQFPYVWGIEIADVNEDARNDVIAGVYVYGVLNVFLQSESGTLEDPIIYGSDKFPATIESGDINGDGRVDLVTLHDNHAGVYMQNPGGGLERECLYPIPYSSNKNLKGVAIADTNSDGLTDVVATDSDHVFTIYRQAAHTPSLRSAVGLELPQDSITLGDSAKMPGTLIFTGRCGTDYAEGGVGEPVKVVRTNPDGSETDLPSVTTDEEGEVVVTDRPTAAGTYGYAAVFEGNSDFPAATSRRVLLHVTKKPSSISLSQPPKVVNYGQRVPFTVHLPVTDTTNPTVSIYATPHGGNPEVVASGQVNADGFLSVRVPVQKLTTFSARWEGDESYLPATSADRLVKVRAVVTQKLSRYYGTSGKYRLYRFGRRVYLTAKVAPNHPKDEVGIGFEVHTPRGWYEFAFESFSLRRGAVRLYLQGLPAGYRYRCKAYFSADADHLRDSSPRVYFKVTR